MLELIWQSHDVVTANWSERPSLSESVSSGLVLAVTTSNWAMPRLTDAQKLYAANDAFAAYCVYRTLSLSARHEGGCIFIEVTDDGKGPPAGGSGRCGGRGRQPGQGRDPGRHGQETGP